MDVSSMLELHRLDGLQQYVSSSYKTQFSDPQFEISHEFHSRFYGIAKKNYVPSMEYLRVRI